MVNYTFCTDLDLITEKERLRALYEHWILKCEAEIRGFQTMIQREELSEHHWQTKRDNIDIWKSDVRKAKYHLTRTNTLLKNLDKPPVLDYTI